MRVYLPCTLPVLAKAVEAGELGPAPLTGYAVTPTLIEWYASGDTEELEYVALTEAARASLRMLSPTEEEPRRVVVAVEVSDGAVQANADLESKGRVSLTRPVPMTKVAAVHIDDRYAVEDVKAAIAALPDADKGDDDARFVVDGAEAHELMWYATQEIPDLLRP
jgi:hypothetical protein